MGVAGAGGVGDIGGARAIDAGRQAVGVVMYVRCGWRLGRAAGCQAAGLHPGPGAAGAGGKDRVGGAGGFIILKIFLKLNNYSQVSRYH